MARILLVAPGTDKHDVGEAWVAFQWASRLSAHHDVTLLTHRKRGHRSAVDQLPGVRVVEWVEPPFVGRLERFNSLFKPWYPLFRRSCRRWIRAALRSGEQFDIAHQPVPVAIRYPTPLTGLGIPYVVGPVGGSLDSPAGFSDEDTAPWYVGLRRLDAFRLRHDRGLRSAFAGATTVLGIAPYVRDTLASVPLQRFAAMSETGIEVLPAVVDRSGREGPVRLLFVGRLIRTKGVRDAVRAMSLLGDLPVVLDVVGDGFDRAACEDLARQQGTSDRITFHGAVPHAKVGDFYRAADVFVFPSYREPGGNAPFEAMSYGLPMVVCDRGGPGFAVTDACGFLLPVENPEQLAGAIAAAVRRLVAEPSTRAAMGLAARERVIENGTWDVRIAQMDQFYSEAMDRAAATA